MANEFIDGLPPEVRGAVLDRLVRVEHRRGDRIWNEGDLPDGVMVIDSGQVAVRAMTLDGDEATLAVLGPGELFGEMALLGQGSRRTASIEALERTRTRRLPTSDWLELRATHPELDEFVTGLVASYVIRLGERLTEALFVPAETRVVRQLLRLSRQMQTDGSPGATVRLTGQNLADLAGTSRQTVSEALSTDRLLEIGVDVVSRGRIAVPDIEALADYESGLKQSNRS